MDGNGWGIVPGKKAAISKALSQHLKELQRDQSRHSSRQVVGEEVREMVG